MIVSRASWGARAPKGSLSSFSSVLGVTLHWSAGDVATNLSDYSPNVRSIQNQHMNGEYTDIAYNFVVAPNGTIYEGRGWNFRSGANGSTHANTHYLAFCYLGGPTTPFTDAATASISWLIAEALRRYPIAIDLQPHSRWVATACPGDVIRSWIANGPAVSPPPSVPIDKDEKVQVFVTTDGTQTWAVTDGLTKRTLGAGENQLLVDLGLVKENKVKWIPKAAWSRIPNAR